MTATATAEARPAVSSEVVSPGIRASLRRSGFWVVAGVLVVAASVVLLLVKGVSGSSSASPLSIDSAAPTGSKAVAEVLRQHGVAVTAAHSLDEALAAASADSTVLIFDPGQLLPGDRYAEAAGMGARLVLVEPDLFELEGLAPTIAAAGQPESTGSSTDTLSALCDLPAARAAGTITISGTTYRSIGTPAGDAAAAGGTSAAAECFPSFGSAYSLVQAGAASAGSGSGGSGSSGNSATQRGPVTVLGAPEVLDNEHITSAGNAALALGLLGQSESLVWYIPTAADVTANGPPSLGALTPGWVTPALALLALVFLAAAVWRGRRLGPVVVENLPVIVRGSETIDGRARLFARAGARTHALDALRIGTATRLASILGLPRSASLQEIIAAVAAVSGIPGTEVAAVLVDRLPHTEADFIGQAQQLAALERSVRAALGLAPP